MKLWPASDCKSRTDDTSDCDCHWGCEYIEEESTESGLEANGWGVNRAWEGMS
jgi:hypothetical protein